MRRKLLPVLWCSNISEICNRLFWYFARKRRRRYEHTIDSESWWWTAQYYRNLSSGSSQELKVYRAFGVINAYALSGWSWKKAYFEETKRLNLMVCFAYCKVKGDHLSSSSKEETLKHSRLLLRYAILLLKLLLYLELFKERCDRHAIWKRNFVAVISVLCISPVTRNLRYTDGVELRRQHQQWFRIKTEKTSCRSYRLLRALFENLVRTWTPALANVWALRKGLAGVAIYSEKKADEAQLTRFMGRAVQRCSEDDSFFF